MSSSGSAAPAGPNVFKNILVGVITTVLGAAVIYFLGFHESGNSEKKKKKEATITAWNSLLQYEKLFQQTTNKMVCLGESETASKEVTDEMEQLIRDMENIKKEESVDNRMQTLVDRRIESYKKRKDLISAYYNDIMALFNQNLPETEAYQQVVAIQKKLGDRVTGMEEKDKVYAVEIKSTLEKEYKTDLKVPEFNNAITKENIAGKWQMNRTNNMVMDVNGSFTISSDTEKATGTWTLTDEKLDFNFSSGEKLSYTVKGLDNMVLRMVDNADGSFMLGCRN
jgi:uncharacterized membrane protein